MSIDGGMNSLSLITAKRHVYNVCMNGSNIVLVSSKQSKRDELGTITKEDTLTLKSFPTRYSPYDSEIIQKIGWAENTDIICYIPKLQVDNSKLTIQSLRQKYGEFRHGNKTYEIKYVEPYSAFADDFLYVVIGGKS